MTHVQAAFPKTAPLRLVSLTADPAHDKPEILRQFAGDFAAESERWFFLTGEKRDVYALAIEGLKLTVIDNEKDREPDEDLFIHSQKFVVVDRSGNIRAYVDGDEPETVPQLIRAVKAVLKEKP
jgi:protein SCO1/2